MKILTFDEFVSSHNEGLVKESATKISKISKNADDFEKKNYSFFTKYKSRFSFLNGFVEDLPDDVTNVLKFFTDPFEDDYLEYMDYEEELKDLNQFIKDNEIG